MESEEMSSIRKLVLVTLMGLPASGKTTFAKTFKTFLEATQSVQVAHVCFDEVFPLAEQLYAVSSADDDDDDDGNAAYKMHRKKFIEIVESNIVSFSQRQLEHCFLDHRTPSPPSVLIVDDNNYYRSMRYEYFKLCRKHAIGYCQFHLKTASVAEAQKYNGKRDAAERVPDQVIAIMAAKLEAPEPLKNAWEQYSFVVRSSGETFDNHQMLQMCWNVAKASSGDPAAGPLKESEEQINEKATSRSICSQNVVHILDKCLRRLVGNRVKNAVRNEDPKVAEIGQKLNSARSQLLKDLRSGKDLSLKVAGALADGTDKELGALAEALLDAKLSELNLGE